MPATLAITLSASGYPLMSLKWLWIPNPRPPQQFVPKIKFCAHKPCLRFTLTFVVDVFALERFLVPQFPCFNRPAWGAHYGAIWGRGPESARNQKLPGRNWLDIEKNF